MSEEGRPPWVVVSRDPPSVNFKDEIWLVCPLDGFDCARVPRNPFGEGWAIDVMAVHVAIHHRRWN